MSRRRPAGWARALSSCGIAIGFAVVFVFGCVPTLAGEEPKPFETLRLPDSKPDSGGCESGWKSVGMSSVWVDEERLIASERYFCRHAPPKHGTPGIELTVFDKARHSRSIFIAGARIALQGPTGALLIGRDNGADLVDDELRTQQSLECPAKGPACQVYAAVTETPGTDFAICSTTKVEHVCDFYQGFPARRISGNTFGKDQWQGVSGPYKRADFPIGTLPEKWRPKNGFCVGSASISMPKRFLAACRGAHFYTDGELDIIFGYAKIGLFDAASRQMLAQISTRSFTAASLSPSGRIVAVWQGREIHLYRVD